MKIDYLTRILNARVYDVAIETPLELAPGLSARFGNRILLKREDLQPVFSFKIRGAYNMMSQLSGAALRRGVICSSAGNHAQGVALAAQHLGGRATIVMPTTTPQIKVAAVTARGAEVILHGDSYSDAYARARVIEAKRGLTFVHPYDDPNVIAGQGTIGMEILRQAHSSQALIRSSVRPSVRSNVRSNVRSSLRPSGAKPPVDAIFAAIGGGGLISGIAAYVKRLHPEIRIIGVQTHDSDAMRRSIAAGRRVVLPHVGLFADGIAVKQVGRETFRLARMLVDEIILVNTDEICAAIKDVFEDTRAILEPAGAVAVAGAKIYAERNGINDHTLVAVACGANTNFDRLRFIAERAEVGEHREAILAVTIPERPGSFMAFCTLLGTRAVTEFNYRIADPKEAQVFVGLQVHNDAEKRAIIAVLRRAGLKTVDLSNDEVAKLHVRHLVGGHAALARDERVYRFEFPERPGALMKFLTSMRSDWNISLFHYRNHGSDTGRVLVGMQVPTRARTAFRRFLASLGYPYQDETQNPAYRLFLGHR